MKTPEQIRIENKLELWNTPGFFQFLEDLCKNLPTATSESNRLKLVYRRRLEEIKSKGNKFKQGELPL